MPRPDDDNAFGLRDVRIPVQRAREVAKRHESHGWLEKAWSFTEGAAYAAVILNPLTMPAVLAFDPRFRRVSLAAARSLSMAPQLMLDESLGVGKALLSGIVPMLGELAKWAGGGALVGGAIGAVGGLGVLDEATIPGGILFGFEAGLMIGGFWGLKDLLLEAAKRLHTFVNYSIDAAELAWYAGDGGTVSEDQDVNAAAKLFAFAIAELWWVILQALIFWVLKRVAGLVAEAGAAAVEGTILEKALAEASQKSAAFGKPFTDWFKTNFTKIKSAVESRNRALKELSESADSGGTPDPDQRQSSSKSKSAAGQSLGRVPPTIKTSIGIDIHPIGGKTTTILGNYRADMKGIINDDLAYPKTEDFGAKPGGYNVLNVPDDLYKTPDQFWEEYNKPFLDQAIDRGDPVALATQPTEDVLVNQQTQQLTGYGREIQYLQQNGYVYDSASSQMVRP